MIPHICLTPNPNPMTHDMIVRKLKAMRKFELDEHRSNL